MAQDLETRAAAVVLLREHVDIDRPSEAVLEGLCADGSCMLPMATGATDDAEAQLVRVGLTVGSRHAAVPVAIRLGHAWTRDGSTAIPIRWEAAVLGSLFPVLDGTLILSPIGKERCRLGLDASYRPPFDSLGQWLDRALLHRIAESTVRSFLRRMADSLTGDKTLGA